jgi:hypothetical protein
MGDGITLFIEDGGRMICNKMTAPNGTKGENVAFEIDARFDMEPNALDRTTTRCIKEWLIRMLERALRYMESGET